MTDILSEIFVEMGQTVATPTDGPATARQRRKTAPFVHVDYEWARKAANLPGACLTVAIVVRFLASTQRTETVALSMSRCRRWGVQRHAVYRALDRLETAGLVSVVRARGKAARVTILNPTEVHA